MIYGFCLAVVYACVITFLAARGHRAGNARPIFSRHQTQPKEKMSWGNQLVYWLFMFVIATLFFPFCFWFMEMFSEILFLNRYEAKVVSVFSYQSTCETKDSRGRTDRYECTMHLPVVRFIDENNLPVEIVTDIASGGEPTVGETMTVGYRTGLQSAKEITLRKILGLLALAVILGLLGLLLRYIFMHHYREAFPFKKSLTK
jgi:hypothetical protein